MRASGVGYGLVGWGTTLLLPAGARLCSGLVHLAFSAHVHPWTALCRSMHEPRTNPTPHAPTSSTTLVAGRTNGFPSCVVGRGAEQRTLPVWPLFIAFWPGATRPSTSTS